MKIIDTDKYRFIISIVSYFIFNKNKDQTRDAPYSDHYWPICFVSILSGLGFFFSSNANIKLFYAIFQ